MSSLIHDPVLIFALVMLIMLGAPLIFARLRLPAIIGLILAGLAAGPHALGLLQQDRIFELLGTVGLVYLMFLTGLEFNLNDFRRKRSSSWIYGFIAYFTAIILGTAGSRLLLGFSWPASVLLAAVFASNTLLTFPIARRLGLARHPAVTAAIGGTILTDTLALLTLAVIVNWMQGSLTVFFWLRQFSLLALLVFLTLWLLPRIGFRFFRFTAPDGSTEYVFVMAAVFLTAFAARLAGVEPIVGSFLAGVALSRLIPEQSPLMNRIQFVGQALFIPFFLISVGMRVNLRILVSGPRVWFVFLSMIGMVLLIKWTSTQLAGRVLRFPREDRRLLFGLCVNQAAAPLAIVLVGYGIGLFNDAVLNGAVLMILATNLVGAWMTEEYGRRIALKFTPSRAEDAGEGAGRIMVPVSREESVAPLLDLALLLRPAPSHDAIYPLFVAQDGVDLDERVAAGEKVLGAATARVVAAAAPVLPITRIDVNVAGGILHALKEFRISTLVLGWNGRVESHRIVFHSILDQILEQSLQMVLVSRMVHPLNTTRRIVLIVPPLIERQTGFAAARQVLLRLATQIGAPLHLLYVQDSHDQARPVLEKGIPSALTTTRQILPAWKNLTATLNGLVKEDDLLVLFSARRARTAWQPSLAHLPGKIGREHPQTNLLVLYPPELTGEEESESAPPAELPTGLTPRRVCLNLDPRELPEALHTLLATAFAPDSPDAQELQARLLHTAPVELAPDIVLLHCHVSAVREPTVFLGTSRSGFVFQAFDVSAKHLLILLSPADLSPNLHLKTLAELARWVQKKEFPQQLDRMAADRFA